jgi:chromosome partitioning protein
MITIGVLAQKGGVGKTTLTLHWAVEALEQSKKPVAVIDIDTPQCSAAAWGERREKETPAVLKAEAHQLSDAVKACAANAIEYAFIDTMPRVERPSLEAARMSDLVVIPCGPSIVDIEAIGDTVSIVNQSGAPAVIVLNQGRTGSSVNEKALSVLEQYEFPVCPVTVMRRAALADAFTDGRAVRELDPHGKAASEISQSWAWIVKELRRAKNKEVKTHAQSRR